jgi:hypothetical protein
VNRPVVPPDLPPGRVVYARLRSFSEVGDRIRLLFEDPSSTTAVLWQSLDDPKPGVGQRVAVEVDDRGKPRAWHPA